jgi:hypothetical protein
MGLDMSSGYHLIYSKSRIQAQTLIRDDAPL